MANKKADTNTTEKVFNAVAKQFIKYNGKHLKAGDKFKVNESHIKELSKYAEIEMPTEDNTSDDSGEGEKAGE